MRKNIVLLATAAALLSVTLPQKTFGPSFAHAQDDDPEVTRMAKEHYKLGLDAYKAGKYDVAIKELKKAYLLKRLPAILINIALTYRKLKDYDMSLYFYKKFITEAPADDKQRPSAESGIGEVEAEKSAALAQPKTEPARPAVEVAPRVKVPAPAAPSAATPAAPANGTAPPAAPAASEGGAPAASTASVTEWSHTPIDAVPPNLPVDVRVQMPVMKGVKVKVFFRKEGQANFDTLELKRRGNEKVARLPAEIASARTFQYYVEARDGAGTMVKSSGSEASPNIVLIDPNARQQIAGAEAEGPDDEELAKRGKGFSRDIENEAARFDVKTEQQKALAQLHQQIGHEQQRKRSPFSTIGWVGVGVLAGGVAGLAGGITLLALASGRADAVTSDSTCVQMVLGKCPHFGPNPDPNLNHAFPSPTSADYDAQGRTFNSAGIGLTAAGGVLTAGGAGLLLYDVLHRMAQERAAQRALKPKGKKHKVKKVIEVEEETRLLITPVVGPTIVGVVGEFRF